MDRGGGSLELLITKKHGESVDLQRLELDLSRSKLPQRGFQEYSQDQKEMGKSLCVDQPAFKEGVIALPSLR